MRKALLVSCCSAMAVGILATSLSLGFGSKTAVAEATAAQRPVFDRRFAVQIVVDGYPLEEYYARGKSYVEAREGAEYEISIRNPLPFRVAVALSVDGLNTIDARRTTAWTASKWVIEPYGAITISGWQMSSQRARRFYFTSERDSYGAKLGQTANLGVISAVFFRERRSSAIPITPPRTRPLYEEDSRREKDSDAPSAGARAQSSGGARQGQIAPVPDDEYAATGIGRSVRNDVRWVNLELDSRPAADVLIRYEYYPALVRLGIMPRPHPRPDSLRRREGATGFEGGRFSPEP